MDKDQKVISIGNSLGEILFAHFDDFVKNQILAPERKKEKFAITDTDFNGYVAAIVFFIKNVAFCFSVPLEDFIDLLLFNVERTEFHYETDTTRSTALN